MSILDNEGHDPQGLMNQPSWSEVSQLRATITRLTAERDRLRASLGHLYWWVHDMPVKHPQQAQWRIEARDLLAALEHRETETK